jgi:hypothetical protein
MCRDREVRVVMCVMVALCSYDTVLDKSQLIAYGRIRSVDQPIASLLN